MINNVEEQGAGGLTLLVDVAPEVHCRYIARSRCIIALTVASTFLR